MDLNPENVLKGIAIGFAIAAPVGPIGVLCIRRSIAEGMLRGLLSGLGAATADTAYAAMGALSTSAVDHWMVAFKPYLTWCAGAFLLYLGVRTLRTKPHTAGSLPVGSAVGAYVSTLMLTLANPMTILSFAAIFAGLGGMDSKSSIALVVGVFAGSACWWLLLSAVTGRVGRHLSVVQMRWINRTCGVTLIGFALYAVGTNL